MKRTYALCLAALIFSACDDSKVENLCGNGSLDPNETCDGDAFASEIYVLCSNGMAARKEALKCTAQCSIDSKDACTPVCGNGILEVGEECDGSTFPTVTVECENPDLTKLSCNNCRISDGGVCAVDGSWVDKNCGNGKLDEGEVCDGKLIRPGIAVCPEGMETVEAPKYSCLSSCRLIDVSNACKPIKRPLCGDGILDEGEECDQTEFSKRALLSATCPDNMIRDISKAECTEQCTITSYCLERPAGGLLISEVVPHFITDGDTMSIDGLAVEIANMTEEKADLKTCSLALLDTTGAKKKYSLSALGLDSLNVKKNAVICSQDGDKFNGVCTAQIDASDGILKNLGGMYYLGIVCGADDEIKDLFNLNSFLTACGKGAVDFIRMCNASASTTSSTAILGEGWTILGDSPDVLQDAPAYNLGSHCGNTDSEVKSCTYRVSRTTLTDRSQSIDLELEVSIPGVTDISDKTDVSKDVRVEFFSGQVQGSAVKSLNIHYAQGSADTDWTNSNGVDRYVAQLNNWDVYQGFMPNEEGTYVLDAGISFDNGETYTYCGPRGIVDHYEQYNADERNTLVVKYGDEEAVCGDRVIGVGEVCDTDVFYENTLTCADPNAIIVDYSKIGCYCTWVFTDMACAVPPETCGNGEIDSDQREVCDGDHFSDSVRVCPAGFIPKPEAEQKWTCLGCLGVDHREACDFACGNGKIDTAVPQKSSDPMDEVCDGNLIPDAAKVCPANMIPKENPTWVCKNDCSGVDSENACVNACGNGKLDKNIPDGEGSVYDEICDKDQFNTELTSIVCGNKTYRADRQSCSDACKLDAAVCIPETKLVFDEFLVKKDEKGKTVGVAISINTYGSQPIQFGLANEGKTSCSFYIMNDEGRFAVDNAHAYAFAPNVSNITSIYKTENPVLDPCKPLVLCSGTEKDGKSVFGDKCDFMTTTTDGNDVVINLFMNAAIGKLRISCNSSTVDIFDFTGLKAAIDAGYTHGKLKSSDIDPWPSYSVSLEKRMDLDKTYDLEAFAKPVCSK